MHRFMRLHISCFFVLLLCIGLYFGHGRIVVAGILAAVCHEMGHVAVLHLYRKKILRIDIGIIGAEIVSETLAYTHEIICALAGPAVNLILFLFCYSDLNYFSLCNVLLFAYNSLPIYPLDGGRVLRCVLMMRLDEIKSEKICRGVSFAVCLCLMMVATCVIVYYRCGLWPLILSSMLFCRIGWTSD